MKEVGLMSTFLLSVDTDYSFKRCLLGKSSAVVRGTNISGSVEAMSQGFLD